MTKLKWVVFYDENLSSQGKLHPLTVEKVHNYNVQQFPFYCVKLECLVDLPEINQWLVSTKLHRKNIRERQ